jgi:hypothetical protein
MAGLRGNIGWIMSQKQTAKGTLATPAVPGVAAGAWKSALSGGGLGLTRTIDQLAETDSSRDQGVSFVSTEQNGGSPEFYVRDDSIGYWLWTVLGADAVAGTTNFTHTITPSNTLPYISAWRDVSDTLWEAYQDCKVSSLAITASAGQPLAATATLAGVASTRLTVDPSTAGPIILSNGYAYNYNDCVVTLSGGVTALVSSFTMTISNNVTSQQTDSVSIYDVIEGQRTIELDFDLIFETLNEYNAFHYGSTSGTTVSPTIYTTSADFKFSHGANNSIEFNMPSIAYTEFPVDVNPNGDPITASIKAIGQRNASPIVTATVKNQVAVY